MRLSKRNGAASRWLSAGVAAALVLAMAAPLAASEEEADLCSRALAKCLGEAILSALLTGGATAAVFLGICFTGWDFCRRYIEY